MNAKDRKAIQAAIENREMVTVQYAKPKGGVVQRHVRPYELSVNRKGRAVVWGSESIHGPRQIHSFRADRIVAVQESKRPTTFEPARSVAKHLQTYSNVGRGTPAPLRGPGVDIVAVVVKAKSKK